jgi:hypothetical protein
MSRNTASQQALTPTSLIDEVMDIFMRAEYSLFADMDYATSPANRAQAGLGRLGDAAPRIIDARDAA